MGQSDDLITQLDAVECALQIFFEDMDNEGQNQTFILQCTQITIVIICTNSKGYNITYLYVQSHHH